MKRVCRVSIAILILSLVGITSHSLWFGGEDGLAAAPNVNPSPQAIQAVNVIRAINTAEVVTCRSENGKLDPRAKFLSWRALTQAPCFRKAQSHYSGRRFGEVSSLSFSSEPEILPGLVLHLVVSSNGKHYNVSLGKTPETHCGFAFFSDERGVIYEGQAIGCSAQGPLGKP